MSNDINENIYAVNMSNDINENIYAIKKKYQNS